MRGESYMRNNIIKSGAILFIQLTIYHLIVFLIPFLRNTVFWISYGFTLAAQVVDAAGYYFAYLKNPDIRSKFYGFPISRMATVYAVTQGILSLVFMGLSEWIPPWIALLVQVSMLGIALIGLIYGKTTMDEIVTLDEKLEQSISFMRRLSIEIRQIESMCENEEVLSAIRIFAEELRFSDPVSNEALTEIENQLQDIVEELYNSVCDGKKEAALILCDKASESLTERNRLCKLHKK